MGELPAHQHQSIIYTYYIWLRYAQHHHADIADDTFHFHRHNMVRTMAWLELLASFFLSGPGLLQRGIQVAKARALVQMEIRDYVSGSTNKVPNLRFPNPCISSSEAWQHVQSQCDDLFLARQDSN